MKLFKLLPILLILLTIGAGAVSAEGVLQDDGWYTWVDDNASNKWYGYEILGEEPEDLNSTDRFTDIPSYINELSTMYEPIPMSNTAMSPAPILGVILGLGSICALTRRL